MPDCVLYYISIKLTLMTIMLKENHALLSIPYFDCQPFPELL